ncbi:GyrI-like domain-containing protein [Pseudomonas caspiana]
MRYIRARRLSQAALTLQRGTPDILKVALDAGYSSHEARFFTIFNQWLPDSGCALADAPEFEQYSSDFEPAQGKGRVDVWIPLVRVEAS